VASHDLGDPANARTVPALVRLALSQLDTLIDQLIDANVFHRLATAPPRTPIVVPKAPAPPPPPTLPVAPGPATFPRSGPAKTTGTLLRIRTAPSLSSTALGLIVDAGTSVAVVTQVKGEPVDGNDVWNQIEHQGRPAFVSARFVRLDADATGAR
jgi:hypothetical protein